MGTVEDDVMATNSKIEWTEATWNPVAGCTPISPGCANCYAVPITYRLETMGQAKYTGLTVLQPNGRRQFNGTVRPDEDSLTVPLAWKKPRRVFVNSMSDLFHEGVPFEFIDRVFAVMSATHTCLPIPTDITTAKPWHTYQILTKRPGRAAEYLESRNPQHWPRCGSHPLFKQREIFIGQGPDIVNASGCLLWPLPNVWLGTSVENQQAADERIPHLLRCPARVRFLSCEPLLGAIDFPQWFVPVYDNGKYRGYEIPGEGLAHGSRPAIDWVIIGGESGARARPCDIAWERSIIDQCKAAGIPCFEKQLGAKPTMQCDQCGKLVGRVLGGFVDACGPTHAALIAELQRISDPKGGDMDEWPEDLRVRELPEAITFKRAEASND